MSRNSTIPPPPPIPPPCFKQKKQTHELFTIEENQESCRVKDVSEQCKHIVQSVVASESNLPLEDVKWLLCNTTVRPQIQGNAPRCGLVALSMAADIAGCLSHERGRSNVTEIYNNETELSDLLALAQTRSYSKQGEMLSALNLAALAEEYYGLCATATCNSFRERDRVLLHLWRGGPILVPYDSAPNHEPCLLNGRKAHWAVMTDDKQYSISLGTSGNIVDNGHLLYSLKNPPRNDIMLPNNIVEDHVYILAKQPKSKHTAVWSLKSLERSNCNLLEFKHHDKDGVLEDFVYPDGGLKAGLCGKLIYLSKSQNN